MFEPRRASVSGLVNADLAGLGDCALSRVVEECGREQARSAGRQLRAIAALDAEWAGTPRADFVADEVALGLRVTHGYASALLRLARTLVVRLPGTFCALEVGDIDLYKARVIAEYTDPLDAAIAAVVENAVLGKAAGWNATELKRALSAAIRRADPEGSRKRREKAKRARRVEMSPEPDGMASLYALLSAEGAAMVMLVLNGLAQAARREPGETRTLEELRADTLVEIFRAILETGAWGGAPMRNRRGERPHVDVTIDAWTLAGLAEHDGYLAGYGPIPAQVARTMAKDATWRRIITDPVTGELIDYGATRYRPGAVLARHVTARDRTCVFPGCTQPAVNGDLDHTIPYPHGPTAAGNLGAFCRHHHRAKQAGFAVDQPTPGTFAWTSPTGRAATVHPTALGPIHPGAEDDVPDHIREAWTEQEIRNRPPDDPDMYTSYDAA